MDSMPERGSKMRVDLRELKPNPTRDFTIDPIDEEAVKALARSIRDDGFWGGIVCRKNGDGVIEIAAGHHRVASALMEGITSADVFVGRDIDDATMVRIYARENATQRGNHSAAIAGSVASAIRVAARKAMSGVSREFTGNGNGKIRGNLMSAKGIGQDVILALLKDTPGINENIIRQQLASLKRSGDYARIIAEVAAEIECEYEEALRQQEEAERANQKQKAAKAKKRVERMTKAMDTAIKAKRASSKEPKTFDLQGVQKYLKNTHQVQVFRDYVTGPGIAPFLPLENQADLAKAIVELAAEQKRELTGQFIRDHIAMMVQQVRGEVRAMTREEKERLEKENRDIRARNHMREFADAFSLVYGAGQKLLKDMKEWPKDRPFPITSTFRSAFARAKEVMDLLAERIEA